MYVQKPFATVPGLHGRRHPQVSMEGNIFFKFFSDMTSASGLLSRFFRDYCERVGVVVFFGCGYGCMARGVFRTDKLGCRCHCSWGYAGTEAPLFGSFLCPYQRQAIPLLPSTLYDVIHMRILYTQYFGYSTICLFPMRWDVTQGLKFCGEPECFHSGHGANFTNPLHSRVPVKLLFVLLRPLEQGLVSHKPDSELSDSKQLGIYPVLPS